MGIINFLQPVNTNWIVNVIIWLVKIAGSVWLGVVLFTVVLKLITLPFDYASKASMRKNSLKMEAMREDLEKLQKQYANDKELYNQKMMALYKKNGYSMWGACLPTILTLVIFIVAINGFTSYSSFQNRQYFYQMSLSYNSVIYEGFDYEDKENALISQKKDGSLVFSDQELYNLANATESKSTVISTTDKDGNAFNVSVEIDTANKKLIVHTDGYMKYVRDFEIVDGADGVKINFGTISYTPVREKFDVAKLKASGMDYIAFAKHQYDLIEKHNSDPKNAENQKEHLTDEQTAELFILDIQQTRSAQTFRENQDRFLWVKNIWVADSMTKHPIEIKWSDFKQAYGYQDSSVNAMTSTDYANLIAKLDKEKTEPNGYFILVALTAVSYLVMQIVTNKSQKAQMELQTVDGQGAQTSKMMTWMMPIMMAVFAFMYTAAFSIYIVLSSLISMLTTFVINLIIDAKFKKEIATDKPQGVIRGRVYNEPPKEEKPKEKKSLFGKKEEPPVNDFLSGRADKKKR